MKRKSNDDKVITICKIILASSVAITSCVCIPQAIKTRSINDQSKFMQAEAKDKTPDNDIIVDEMNVQNNAKTSYEPITGELVDADKLKTQTETIITKSLYKDVDNPDGPLMGTGAVPENIGETVFVVRKDDAKKSDDIDYDPYLTQGYDQTIMCVNPIHNAYTNGCLTKDTGVFDGPSGRETYYNIDMSNVVTMMRNMGFSEEHYPYWEREDGCKMLGDYIIVAADLNNPERMRGSLVSTSLGQGIVCDTGDFVYTDPYQIDIAVNW